MQQPANVHNGHYLGQKQCPSLSQTEETDDNSQFYEDEVDLQDLQLEAGKSYYFFKM